MRKKAYALMRFGDDFPCSMGYNRTMKKIWKYYFPVMTAVMLVMSLIGVYGFITAPAKAKAHQKEVEELLLKRQEEADKMKNAIEHLGDEGETEFNPDLLRYKYTNAKQMRVVGIGDSVMLTAAPQLNEVFPHGYFNVVYGRTMADGQDALEELEAQGKLGDVVVFGLGTNSYISDADCESLIRHSGNRPVFFITTYGVSNDSNEVMTRVANQHDNAFMIDWETLALDHRSEYILSDALHPTVTGSYAYAELIARSINEKVLGNPLFSMAVKGIPFEVQNGN